MPARARVPLARPGRIARWSWRASRAASCGCRWARTRSVASRISPVVVVASCQHAAQDTTAQVARPSCLLPRSGGAFAPDLGLECPIGIVTTASLEKPRVAGLRRTHRLRRSYNQRRSRRLRRSLGRIGGGDPINCGYPVGYGDPLGGGEAIGYGDPTGGGDPTGTQFDSSSPPQRPRIGPHRPQMAQRPDDPTAISTNAMGWGDPTGCNDPMNCSDPMDSFPTNSPAVFPPSFLRVVRHSACSSPSSRHPSPRVPGVCVVEPISWFIGDQVQFGCARGGLYRRSNICRARPVRSPERGSFGILPGSGRSRLGYDEHIRHGILWRSRFCGSRDGLAELGHTGVEPQNRFRRAGGTSCRRNPSLERRCRAGIPNGPRSGPRAGDPAPSWGAQ